MKISLVFAMAHNRVIGDNNRLPWYLPEDLRKVKELTTGHILLMGRKTFESLPKVLPGRDHYVITHSEDYKNTNPMAQGSDHVFVAGSPQEALGMIRERLILDKNLSDEIFVFGGSEVFLQMLPLSNRMYITEIKEDKEGDVFFPEIDAAQWKEVSRQVFDKFDFAVYDRI